MEGRNHVAVANAMAPSLLEDPCHIDPQGVAVGKKRGNDVLGQGDMLMAAGHTHCCTPSSVEAGVDVVGADAGSDNKGLVEANGDYVAEKEVVKAGREVLGRRFRPP